MKGGGGGTEKHTRERRAKNQHALEGFSAGQQQQLVCSTYSTPILPYFPRLCINGKFAWEPASVCEEHADFGNTFYGLGLDKSNKHSIVGLSAAQRKSILKLPES